MPVATGSSIHGSDNNQFNCPQLEVTRLLPTRRRPRRRGAVFCRLLLRQPLLLHVVVVHTDQILGPWTDPVHAGLRRRINLRPKPCVLHTPIAHNREQQFSRQYYQVRSSCNGGSCQGTATPTHLSRLHASDERDRLWCVLVLTTREPPHHLFPKRLLWKSTVVSFSVPLDHAHELLALHHLGPVSRPCQWSSPKKSPSL